MATVFDVAEYILQVKGNMSAMKLQKLVYYSQAWSLVWDDAALFEDEIEAWANGPVVRSLYSHHRGQFIVSAEHFELDRREGLTTIQRETIDIVLESYGDKSAQWLSDQTHYESPWREAREGMDEGERGDRVISQESMSEYYSALQ